MIVSPLQVKLNFQHKGLDMGRVKGGEAHNLLALVRTCRPKP